MIETDRMSASPEPISSCLPLDPLPDSTASSNSIKATPKKKLQKEQVINAWSSPMFLKNRRLPDIHPLNNNFDPFLGDDDWEADRPTKKVKFGRKSDQWTFVNRSSSPEEDEAASIEEKAPAPAAETGSERIGSVPVSNSALIGNITTQGNSEVKLADLSPRVDAVPVSLVQSSLIEQPGSPGPFAEVYIQETILKSTDNAQISYPVLTTPITGSNGALDEFTEPLHHVSQHEQDTEGYQIQLDSESHSISQFLSGPPELTATPRDRRSPSRTPEPSLRIEIRGATPLPDAVHEDQQPLTPRLQPIPSPGLMTVSPIEQGQRSPLEYFERAVRTSQTSKPIDESQNDSSSATNNAQRVETGNSRQLDTGVSYINPDADSNHETAEKVDTFFGKLLAHYNQGTIEETGVNLSHVDPPEETLISEIEMLDEVENKALEDLPMNQDQTPNINASEIETHNITVITTQEYKREEISRETESDESEDIDSMKYGKLRDMTYKPSYEDPSFTESHTDSLLLTEYPKPQDIGLEHTTEQQESKRPTKSSSPSTSASESRIVQNTYFVHDELERGTSPSIDTGNTPIIEVVDLLESASSSPEPEKSLRPESNGKSKTLTPDPVADEVQHTTKNEEDITTTIVPAVEEDLISEPQYREDTMPFDHDQAKSEDHNQINPDSENEFFTAPSKILGEFDVETTDLTPIPEDEAPIKNTKTPIDDEPANLSSVESNKLERAPLKSMPAQYSQIAEQKVRTPRRITRSQSQHQAESETSKEVVPTLTQTAESTTTQNQTQEMSRGFRTAHDYYSTLLTLGEFYNNNTSVLAVVVAASKPIRATAGPRDFNQTLYLSSPYLKEDHSEFTLAQLFRPYSSSLPHPVPFGSVILLKEFKVQSFQRKMSLLSTETSAWAVFDHVSATNQSDMKVSIPGPPLEFGAAERGVAWGLGKWWNTLNKEAKSKIEESAVKARDKAEAELEKKVTAARSKTSSQSKTRSQTHTSVRRQTRSTQNQPLQSSIPNTPTTSPPIYRQTRSNQAAKSHSPAAPTTPTPAHRRTRSSQQSPPTSPANSLTPTPTKSRHNTRSSPFISESQPQSQQTVNTEHELRSGMAHSDHEFELAEIPSRSEHAESAPASGRGRKTRLKEKNDEDVAAGSQNMEGTEKGKKGSLWHELRDGAVYKD